MKHLSQIRTLDGQFVDHKEKAKAACLFGEDLERRKDIFCNYLPEDDWVDRRLFVAEQIDPESDSDEEVEKRRIKTDGGRKDQTLSTLGDKRNFDEFQDTLNDDRKNYTYNN